MRVYDTSKGGGVALAGGTPPLHTARLPPFKVKPLDQTPWLVRIVSFRDVLIDQREDRLRVIVERDPNERTLRILRFFEELRDVTVARNFNGTVFLHDFIRSHKISPNLFCPLLANR